MGNLEYLLGTAFTWLRHADGNISIHLCQLSFTEFIAHQLSFHISNKVPNMNPFCFGFPMGSILPVDTLDHDLLRQKQIYQSIGSCIKWLATCTWPDIAPVLKFLASYINAPHPQHYKSASHAIKDITSTNEFGISFHSKSSSTIQAFNHFPHNHDKEYYTEATAQTPS